MGQVGGDGKLLLIVLRLGGVFGIRRNRQRAKPNLGLEGTDRGRRTATVVSLQDSSQSDRASGPEEDTEQSFTTDVAHRLG